MPCEIITVAQMRAIDAAAARAGTASRVLMERAGHGAAARIASRYAPCRTGVLCGPGNNGGDGWVVARALQERGWPVWVATLAAPEALTGDVADAARAWTGETYRSGPDNPSADLFVDALFGAGLSRPLSDEAARLAHSLASAPDSVVAVDVPSGLAADTGKPLGGVSFRAGLTVTFVRKKPAHVLMPGREICGAVDLVDIGVPDAIVAAEAVQVFENDPKMWRLPRPGRNTHKHARGQVFAVSGGRMRTGAARLSARAALRVGAGLVTVVSPPDAVAENAAHLTAIMVREAASPQDYVAASASAQSVVVGPAFGTTFAHSDVLRAMLGAAARSPFVIDADAITLLAPLTKCLGAQDVLTPHVGEFKRAFPDVLEAAATRIEAARIAAARADCVVLLKGPDTVIASPDGRAIINTTGTPWLATAGSGDVLAGLIAGLIAQGMTSFHAAAAAAWLHGKAGEGLGPGLIAEDVPDFLPRILSALHATGEG